MDTSQPPPRRKAAIKATTQLADLSSSDEDNDAGNESGDYGVRTKQTTRRVKGSESTRKPTEGRTHAKKGSVVGAVISGKGKRKRATSNVTGGPRKRHHGDTRRRSVGTAGGGSNDGSDLTPLSSDTEQEKPKSFARPIAEFPLKFTSPPSSPSRHKANPARLKPFPSPKISDLGDDSDELPDVGLVLSQQDVSPSKETNHQKLRISTPKDYSNTQAKRTCNDTLSSLASSPTPPPPSTQETSSLLFPPRRSPTYDGARTEAYSSDHHGSQDFSGDSDLELDSVGVGELCLAKAKAGGTFYWPAKVIQVKRSTGKPGGKQKKAFRVMFLDKLEKDIPRSWFYTSSQKEFRTCSIGQFESSHVEVINDIDEDSRQNDTSRSHRRNLQSPSRSPSPVNTPSLPLSGPAYCDLSLRQQVTYVTPILKAIMNEEYTWGLRRHELFIKGGTSRQRLLNEGGMRGAVDPRSVDELLILVEYWCLGGRGRDFMGDDPGEDQAAGCLHRDISQDDGKEKVGVVEPLESALEIGTRTTCDQGSEAQNTTSVPASSEAVIDIPRHPEPTVEEPQGPENHQIKTSPEEHVLTEESRAPSPPPPTQRSLQSGVHSPKRKRPRQHGSPAYEELSPLDKVQYCIEVLLPEAINQILLWRTGERKSIEVMWEDQQEEERLHERGEELLRETDWVMDIMRLRRALERGTGTKEKEKPGSKKGSQGKDVRKTRSGRLGGVVGSYKE